MGRRARVLLLHDDSRTVEAATALLEAAGYDVTISGRRHGRLDYITRLRPDLLLLGIRLPYMEGDEVLQACSQNPVLKTIPTLILSASDPAYLDEIVRRSGAAGFLAPRRLREELVARVADCLARRPPADQPSSAA